MQSIASMREYINDYARSKSTFEVGTKVLKEHFGIPFEQNATDSYQINGVFMSEIETQDYIKEFFEGIDPVAVIDLYNNIVS